VGSAEGAALQKLTGDQLVQLSLRQAENQKHLIDVQEKRLDREDAAQERRDLRAHAREKEDGARAERFGWALFALVAVVAGWLFVKGDTKEGIAVVTMAITHLIAFFGGIGIQRGRERRERKSQDDS
jgi:hypothetical protein